METKVSKLLTWGAKRIIRKHQPKVVAVTGSIGKTSTKDAIALVFGSDLPSRKSPESYNNELGVPLTILGQQAPGRNPTRWLRTLRSIFGTRGRQYPQVLVLEMAADHPGDIGKLVQIAPPTVGVLTGITPVHTEFFGTLDAVAEEKGSLIASLPEQGIAVLNRDDALVWEQRQRTRATVLSYGFHGDADIGVAQTELCGTFEGKTEEDRIGMHAKIKIQGNEFPLTIPRLLGQHQLYPVLAAIGVGSALGIEATTILDRVKAYRVPLGRLRLISGIKYTWIIDDTYNSSPAAAVAALEVLAKLPGGKKFAVLGDMEELGNLTEESHRAVGAKAAETADILIAVGEKSRATADEAKKRGMDDDRVFTFSDRARAGRFAQERIRKGDLVLVKGSQASRMEHVVKELMAEPLQAQKLLIRQSATWRRK